MEMEMVMGDWSYQLRHRLFGTVFVVIESKDGDLEVKPVKSIADKPHVDYGHGWTFLLSDNGKLCGAASTAFKEWRPYIPANSATKPCIGEWNQSE